MKRGSIFCLIAILISVVIPTAVYAAYGVDYGGIISVERQTISGRIDFHLTIDSKSLNKSIGSDSTSMGNLPVVVIHRDNRLKIGFSVVGIENYKVEEIGLTPDNGETRYPLKRSVNGDISLIDDLTIFDSGFKTFKLYGAYYDSKRVLHVIIFDFVTDSKESFKAGVIIHFVEAPDNWMELSIPERLSYCHGFLPCQAWTNNQPLLDYMKQQRIAAMPKYGKLVIYKRPTQEQENVLVECKKPGDNPSKILPFKCWQKLELKILQGLEVRVKIENGMWSDWYRTTEYATINLK